VQISILLKHKIWRNISSFINFTLLVVIVWVVRFRTLNIPATGDDLMSDSKGFKEIQAVSIKALNGFERIKNIKCPNCPSRERAIDSHFFTVNNNIFFSEQQLQGADADNEVNKHIVVGGKGGG
jgi:hypothetical protein